MKITFKNVGQGDSIIIEWKENQSKKIILIDCNKINGINPVLNYLKSIKIASIYCLILSHPHIDHFRGMLELLNYCEQEDIVIERFAHTLRLEPRHLNYSSIDPTDMSKLSKLIEKVNELYDIKKIIKYLYVEEAWTLTIANKWQISSLAPSQNEINLYIEIIKNFYKTNRNKCSKAANLLSTIFKLTNLETNTNVVLTADAEKEAFGRLVDRNEEFFETELLLGQVPHHGSSFNHKIEFWQKFLKKDKTPIVISAGENMKYNHPHKEVVSDFIDNGFQVFATNNVNGMRDFMDELEGNTVILELDDDSELVEPYNIDGDQVFKIENGIAENIPVS
jgi:beta-lactamase superfamily II metal-dependent hydrolase